jgi:lipopolysaccharide/colanic/teichoic acid biosynthesis glycosyltransferase
MGTKVYWTEHPIFGVASNCVCAVVSFILGLSISPQVKITRISGEEIWGLIWELLIFSGCVVVSSYINGHSRRMFERSRIDFIINIAVSVAVGCLVFVLVNYGFQYSLVGRWVVGISALSYIVLVYFSAAAVGGGSRQGVVIGLLGDARLDSVLESLRLFAPISRLNVQNAFGNFVSKADGFSNDIIDRASYLIVGSRDCYSSKVINCLSHKALQKISTIEYVVENEFFVMTPAGITWDNWWEVPTKLRCGLYASSKRILDFVIVGMLALPAIIVLLVAAIIIKLEDGGPVFYRQTRLGQFRLPFSILKLRSMRVGAETRGAQWATVDDDRVTLIGRVLRRTRIDELPQLWNILKGDMSMIGPRPERPEFYDAIEKSVPKFGLRLVCKPGLTGWAQVNYPYGASVEDARNKLLYDLFYITKADFLFELRIVSRTVVAMVRGAR